MIFCQRCQSMLDHEHVLIGHCEQCFAEIQQEHKARKLRFRAAQSFYNGLDESEYLELLGVEIRHNN